VPVTTLAKSDLHETDPATWTLPRLVELYEDCLKLAKTFQPDLIIYDFFSLEGYFVGKSLNIPYWCSIPALIGPFTHRDYLNTKLQLSENIDALKKLNQKYGIAIDIKIIEMISDGLHLPGQINIIWSYPSLVPPNMLTNRHKKEYVFVGHLRGETNNFPTKKEIDRPLVYLSFGTVVMDNLWNQQTTIRSNLREFVKTLAKLWEHKPFDVLFVNRGKPILKEYPRNWRVADHVDQVAVLSRSSVFITHGGANSFHEAVLQSVPMVVVPFFGDQPLVAKQIERLHIGINVVSDSEIDTKKSKSFLNVSLAEHVDNAVATILKNQNKYKNNFSNIPLKRTNIKSLIQEKLNKKNRLY